MSNHAPNRSAPQILFWPRWSEEAGLKHLWAVAERLVRQGRFHLVLRHDPEFDGPLEEALETLQRTFHAYLGDAISLSVSMMTATREDLDWAGIQNAVRVVYRFGDEPLDIFEHVALPVASDVPELLHILGFRGVTRSPAELFAANLQAIERRDPNLAARLRSAAPGNHLRRNEGAWEIRFRRHWVALGQSEEDYGLDVSKPVLVLGLGVGDDVHRMLKSDCDVLAWDRDPWLMCVALSRRDWSTELATGRLRLLLGADILTIPHAYQQEWRHSLLAELYAREIRMWMEPDKPVALVVQGELFVDDAADALERQGYVTYMWDTRSLPVDELAYVAKRLHPKFVMSINYQRGLAEGCRALKLPLVVWEIDPALDHLQECETSTDHCHVFTWRQKQVAAWRNARFENVTHMPLAANHHRRTPGVLTPQESRYRASVSFVGSSLGDTVAYCRQEFIRCWQTWSGRNDVHEPNQIVEYILKVHRDHPDIYAVEEMLARRCPGLEHFSEEGANPAMLVGELVAHQYRRQVVESLAPLGIHVWGDEGWLGVDKSGGRFMGPASHNREVTRIYRGSQINVDVGRRYQRDIVTMRVFDVLACGGFVLAEHCADLEACFETGVHLDTWSTIDELVEKVKWYGQRPELVDTIRKQGHQHLLNLHTIDQRIATIVESMQPVALV